MSDLAKRNKIKYIKEYQKKFYTNFSFKLRTVEDADLILLLRGVKNKSKFIRTLLEAEFKHGK